MCTFSPVAVIVISTRWNVFPGKTPLPNDLSINQSVTLFVP